MTTSATHPPAKLRDNRIDFWRGLCLIDMVLVHLVYQGMQFGQPLQGILGEYTRFAAGGFVLIAGMAIGAVFLPRAADPARRPATYLWLLKRAAFILGVHWTAETSYLVFYPPITGLQLDASFAQALADVLLLRRGSGLLPFYVVMIGLTPAFLEVLRRRGGGLLLSTMSVALFAWGQQGDNAWLIGWQVQNEFILVLWQGIFVAGLLAGANLKRFDALSHRSKVVAAGCAAVAFGVLWYSAYAPDFGLTPLLAIPFWKTPLTTGETLKYFATVGLIMSGSSLAWRWLSRTALIDLVARLGRNSLLVYVAHVWIVLLMVQLSWRNGTAGAANLCLAAIALALLWAIAWAAEQPLRVPTFRLPELSWRRAAPPLAGAVAGAATLVLLVRGLLLPADPSDVLEQPTQIVLDADATDASAETQLINELLEDSAEPLEGSGEAPTPLEADAVAVPA